MVTQPSRAVLTLATGKPIYIQMAVNLLRSLRWWHRHSDICFVLATDQRHLLPLDLQDIDVIELQPGQFGHGFSPKLHLDKIAPADRTLFVDADCLCVGSLEPIFNHFAGRSVSAVGGSIATGEWFGDVAAVCRQFGVDSLPKFNGGVYYLERGDLSDRIYATARELEPQYDEFGLVRLRNRPNDELLMAIAMAIHGQSTVADTGTILGDPQACPSELSIDVLRGISRLVNPAPPHPLHQVWYPFQEIHPVLVHFLGHHTSTYPYTREQRRLELTMAHCYPVWMADIAAMAYALPQLGSNALKDLLRPAYRQLFGSRPVKISERLISD